MVDVPPSWQLRWSWPPVATGSVIYRSWAGSYSEQRGLTYQTGVENGYNTYHNNILNDAFRHNFTAAALYVDAYAESIQAGNTADIADQQATFSVLAWGAVNEWYAPNPFEGHLKDYWNNYNGVLIGRAAVIDIGTGVTNDQIADIVRDQIADTLSRPIGEGPIVIFRGGGRDGAGNPNTDLDPRLTVANYDRARLPNDAWFPNDGSNWPRAIITPQIIVDAFRPQGDTAVGNNVTIVEKTYPDLSSLSLLYGPLYQGEPGFGNMTSGWDQLQMSSPGTLALSNNALLFDENLTGYPPQTLTPGPAVVDLDWSAYTSFAPTESGVTVLEKTYPDLSSLNLLYGPLYQGEPGFGNMTSGWDQLQMSPLGISALNNNALLFDENLTGYPTQTLSPGPAVVVSDWSAYTSFTPTVSGATYPDLSYAWAGVWDNRYYFNSYGFNSTNFDWSNIDTSNALCYDSNSGEYVSCDFPIVLDLDGNGVSITQLENSNTYFDMVGDNYQHRTAWAGAGDGVLVYDPDDTGEITQKNQVVFTEWDPTATSDMQALKNVFDTSNNGILDASDANFSKFKVLVTNADGTQSLRTLAEAGITSIDLTADATSIMLPDGSSIDGQTTFTRNDGTTGTVATVTFAADAQGYAVTQTITHNGDGSTTIENKALNADGSVASDITTVTSADGSQRTISFDLNGDGVVDKVQSSVTVTNADGSSTETLSNANGAGVLKERFVTTTSADGSSITIARDLDGNGTNDQIETRITAADGAFANGLTNLNQDGSTLSQTTAVLSADRLTRTTSSDVDGSRTETITDTNNDGSLRDRTITVTSADGRSKTSTTDQDGDGDIDLTSSLSIVVAVTGTTTWPSPHRQPIPRSDPRSIGWRHAQLGSECIERLLQGPHGASAWRSRNRIYPMPTANCPR